MFTFQSKTGFSLLEIVISAAIFVSALTIFVTSLNFLHRLSNSTSAKTEVAILLEEGAEAVTLLRDNDWNNIASLTNEGEFCLYFDGSAYQISADKQIIASDYFRTIEVIPVFRNAGGVLSNSGTEDENTRHVFIRVGVSNSDEVLVTSEMLIHNSYE